MELTNKEKPIAIIATKCDKLSRNQRIHNAKKIANELLIGTDSIFYSSSRTREGKDEIINLIEELAV